MVANIVIAGDVVVSSIAYSNFNSSYIDSKLAKVIREADYSMVNFEAPVKTNYSKPITKTGQNLSQSEKVIDILKSVGFNCFTLANNHFRDYGHDACENTLVLLQTKGIDRVGGGINITDAAKILYKCINNIQVAFINVC